MKTSKFKSLFDKCSTNNSYEVNELPVQNARSVFIIKKTNEVLPLFEKFLVFAEAKYLKNYDLKKIHNFFLNNENQSELTLTKITNMLVMYSDEVERNSYLHSQMNFLAKYLYYLYSHGYILFPANKNLFISNIPLNTRHYYIISNNNNKLLHIIDKLSEEHKAIKGQIFVVLLQININRHLDLNDEDIKELSKQYSKNLSTSINKFFKNFSILYGNNSLTISKNDNLMHIEKSKRHDIENRVEALDDLPVINTTKKFLIISKIQNINELSKYYEDFQKSFIEIEKQTISEYLNKYSDFKLENFENFEHLIKYYLYVKSVNTNKSSLTKHMNLIYRFLLYLVARSKILFPPNPEYALSTSTLEYRIKYYQTNKETELYSYIHKIKTYWNKNDISETTALVHRKHIIFSFGSINYKKYKQINLDLFIEFERALISSDYYKSSNTAIEVVRVVINYFIYQLGINSLEKPSEIRYGRISKSLEKERTKINFSWIDSSKQNHKFMQEIATYYIKFRKDKEKIALSTIDGNISEINAYFDWLFKYYPNEEYTAEFIYKTFDFLENEKDSYPSYILNKDYSLYTKQSKIQTVMRMFRIVSKRKFTELTGCIDELSGVTIKSTKNFSTTVKMDTVLYLKMLDIFTNRPPKYTSVATSFDRSRFDTDWWEHNVYPALPIAIVLMLLAAQRSANALNICREKSFIFKDNKLQKIIINTDKSTNRKEMPEIPNSWSYFDDIVVPFLDWHKKYFPKMKEITYNDDDNTPWEKYTPLFNLPNSDYPMKRETLMSYWKRGLAQAQIELKHEGLDYKIVWNKNGKPFPNSIEGIEKLSSNYYKKDVDVLHKLHSIRGSSLSYYHSKGVSPLVLMSLAGHASLDMIYKFYLEADEEHIKQQFIKISNEEGFNHIDKIITSSNNIINNEISYIFLKSKDDGEVHNYLHSKGLFFLDRKSEANTNGSNKSKLTLPHPATWKSMIYGICPGSTCPNGVPQCSMCPYFITGYIFIKGIIFELNRLYILLHKIQLDLIQYSKDSEEVATKNLQQDYENLILEIVGWIDVLDTVSNTNLDTRDDETLANIESSKKLVSVHQIDSDIGILEYISEASKIKGMPVDSYIKHHISKMAILYAKNDENFDSIIDIISDDKKVIDYMLSQYEQSKESELLMNDFRYKLKNNQKNLLLNSIV